MKFSTTNRELRRALSLLKPITDNAETILILMSVELMLNAVALNFVAFGVYTDSELFRGLIFGIFVNPPCPVRMPIKRGERAVEADRLRQEQPVLFAVLWNQRDPGPDSVVRPTYIHELATHQNFTLCPRISPENRPQCFCSARANQPSDAKDLT